MALQPRAEATRRRILDAAVALFDERGYGSTGLTDIVDAAGLSKGAFYYHFAAKEDVAAAIVEEYHLSQVENWSRVDLDAPLVAQMITTSFANTARIFTDKLWLVGQNLLQSLEQVSPGSAGIVEYWRGYFIELATLAHRAGEILPEVDPVHFGETFWLTVMATHMVSASSDDDPFERVSRAWLMYLRVTVPAADLSGYEQLCAELVAYHNGESLSG